MAVRDLLKKTRRKVVSAPAEISVHQAISLLEKEKLEVLVVEQDERPVGIFSIFDCLRLYLDKNNKTHVDLTLEEVMTRKVISTSPGEKTDAIMEIMLRSNIDHLPVIDDGRLIGLVHVQDLMLDHIQSLEDEIRRMKDYIDDLHEAGWD
jgi:CBS domain-containing protein